MNNVANFASYDSILLRRTWILERLRRGDIQEAIHLLLSIPEDKIHIPYKNWPSGLLKEFTPSSVLKVRSYLQHSHERCFFNKDYPEAIAYVEVLAWFAYFEQHSQPLLPALNVFEEAKKMVLQDQAHYVELLSQAQTNLLTWHTLKSTSSRSYRPADIKPILMKNINEFPSNTILKAAYLTHQQSFALDDKLRQVNIFTKKEDVQESIVSWLFEIFSETRRLPELGGTTHGLRSVFDKAVNSKRYGFLKVNMNCI
jgi:hypothetical protein